MRDPKPNDDNQTWEDILAVADSNTETIEVDAGANYLRLDEIEDFIISIELAAELSERLDDKPGYWKWFCQAVHAALQGAMVRAISGTAQIGALEQRDARHWAEWLEKRRVEPSAPMPTSQKLADFNELLKRIQQPEFMAEYGGDPVGLSGTDEQLIRRLHTEIRNGLVHFKPMSWSIEVDLLRKCTTSALQLFQSLIEHQAVCYRLDKSQQSRLDSALLALKNLSSK